MSLPKRRVQRTGTFHRVRATDKRYRLLWNRLFKFFIGNWQGSSQSLSVATRTKQEFRQLREIKSHTSLRGIAALLVVFHHYRVNLPSELNPDNYTRFFDSAASFVDFFFMLSGFVIAYVYINRPTDWLSFFRSRFARIYPLHFFTLMWMIALGVYTKGSLSEQVVSNIILVHAWGIFDAYHLNFPSWSISGEFAAYLSFPLVLYLIRWPWALLTACSAVIGLHEILVFHIDLPWERLALLRAVPGFCIGVLLHSRRDVFKHMSQQSISAMQFILALLIVFMLHIGFSLPLLMPAYAVLILATYEDRGVVARALSNPVLHWLGLLSYTIYLLHVPVRATGYHVWPKIASGLAEPFSSVLFVAACGVATLVLSVAVYNYFEIPVRKRINGK